MQTQEMRPGVDYELINTVQACARAGVSRRTLYNWMRDGKVAYVVNAGGKRRIIAETLWKTRCA